MPSSCLAGLWNLAIQLIGMIPHLARNAPSSPEKVSPSCHQPYPALSPTQSDMLSLTLILEGGDIT